MITDDGMGKAWKDVYETDANIHLPGMNMSCLKSINHEEEKMRRISGQKGFTLVELAIVMVIIGLMIGAVLKGQAMIDDAKQKRMLNDLQGISAAFFTYYDRIIVL